jgi:hypothetical protein
MAAGRRGASVVVAAGVFAAGLTLAPAPASAGFFEQLFGGLRHAFSHRAEPPRHAESFADPFTSLARALSSDEPRGREHVVSRNTGPVRGFCVRTCDGRYFPVQAHAGMSAADACRSFCPASETRVYSGSDIDYATTSDGSRYADLPNAYRYRKQLVTGCTCDGRSAFGLAKVDVASDPTLRSGDVVATKSGLMAVAGAHGKTADFTPVEASRLPQSERDALAQVRVRPDYSTPRSETTGSIAPSESHSAQLAK